MIKLSGILDYSMGGFLCLRGYTSYKILSTISDPNPDIQRNLIDEHMGEMAEFLKKGEYLFFPEVILSMELSENLENEELVQQFYSDLHGGKTWNKRIGDISFSISQNLTKNYLTSIDPNLPLVNRINIAHIVFEESRHRLLRIDGNHRLSAGEELNRFINIPFCLLLFGNHGDNERNSTAIFHNINAKQIPLKLEENLRVILQSDSVYSDSFLQRDPSFGWAYYLARKAAQKISFSDYPFVHALVEHDMYSYLLEVFDSLLKCGYLAAEEESLSIFERQLSDIETALREAQLHSVPQNLAVIGALSYYKLTDQDKYQQFILWIKENCISEAPDIHMQDLISIYDKVYENTPKSVFVSMKFGDETADTYQTICDIKDILKRENRIDLNIVKVDEHTDGYSADIYGRIVDGIRHSSLVIADLSYGNKNVHHEIGYAQGIGKKVLLIYQQRAGSDPKDEIGSNLTMFDQLRFKNQAELRPRLLKKIRQFFRILDDEV